MNLTYERQVYGVAQRLYEHMRPAEYVELDQDGNGELKSWDSLWDEEQAEFLALADAAIDAVDEVTEIATGQGRPMRGKDTCLELRNELRTLITQRADGARLDRWRITLETPISLAAVIPGRGEKPACHLYVDTHSFTLDVQRPHIELHPVLDLLNRHFPTVPIGPQ